MKPPLTVIDCLKHHRPVRPWHELCGYGATLLVLALLSAAGVLWLISWVFDVGVPK